MTDSEQKVPTQQEGASSDIHHEVEASNEQEAKEWYIMARNKLCHINQWKSYAGELSASFTLTDANGHQVERHPAQGDYIKIHLPTSSEDKFEWVRIEKVNEEHSGNEVSMMEVQVRPSQPPNQPGETEHFFSKESTSSFFVERNGKKIAAYVRGRNELPNLETPGVFNKIRNAIIAIVAMTGLNAPQWKALVKGLLEK